MRSGDLGPQRAYITSLWRLSAALNSSLDLPRVLETAQQLIVDCTGAERGLVLLVDEEDKGLSPTAETEAPTLLERALAGEVAQGIEGVDDDWATAGATSRGVRCVLCVPLPVQGRVIGALYLESRSRFDTWHRELVVAFANHAAVAIENARLYGRLEAEYEERMRLQRKFLETEQRRITLEEVSRAKSDVLHHVSHELRNPLTVIRGIIEQLIRHGDARYDVTARRNFYEGIAAKSDRLHALILGNLDAARLDAGRPISLRREPFDLEALLRYITRSAPYYPRFTDNHRIDLELPELLPEIVADEDRLFQVLHNLVSNAIKYSPDGGLVTLGARIEGEEVVVSVTDEGDGIPPDQVERLFTPFGTVDEEGRPRLGGTGLGLYLAHHLVQLHGGRIWVEPRETGQGSRFHFTLPLVEGEEEKWSQLRNR